MKAVVRGKPPIGLTEQEKGIVFGVVLGTLLGQFIAALIRSSNTAKKVTRNVGEG